MINIVTKRLVTIFRSPWLGGQKKGSCERTEQLLQHTVLEPKRCLCKNSLYERSQFHFTDEGPTLLYFERIK